jgi:GH25 family lysozyme M1 (1,4-beta-N-acetylmuramidase)
MQFQALVGRCVRAIFCLITSLLLAGSTAAQNQGQPEFSLSELRVLVHPRKADSFAIALEKPKKQFVLPANAASKGGVFGIDVSHYDTECDGCTCSIDWKRSVASQGIRFAYAEASRGTSWTDDSFPIYWQALKPLHMAGQIYRGGFHWLTSDDAVAGADQAKYFLKMVGQNEPRLPDIVDFEEDPVPVTKDYYDAHQAIYWCKAKNKKVGGQEQTSYFCDGWHGKDPKAIAAKLRDWIDTIEQAGSKGIIYTRRGYWDEKVKHEGDDLLARHALWLARYADPATYSDPGKPQSVDPPINKWGMPPLPGAGAYPRGQTYNVPTFWQFVEDGKFQKPVWICNGEMVVRKMDMNWFPSSLADFKKSFGVK